MMQRFKKKLLRALFNHDPGYYDMCADANEQAFAEVYVHHIEQYLQSENIKPPAKILEAGCQAGRLLLPFAQQGYQMTGIDASGFALRKAKHHGKSVGCKLKLLRGDLFDVLKSNRVELQDALICAEVIYMIQEYQELLRLMISTLKPGGLLCVSHRTPYFYWLNSLRQGDEAAADRALKTREGALPGGDYFNWQDESDLQALYSSLDCDVLGMHPIDRFSWLSGVAPADMNAEQREDWKNYEVTQEGMERWAKYMLVIVRTPK